MPPKTASSAAKDAKGQTLQERKERELHQLRTLRHKYAPKVAQQARVLELAAKKLIQLHKELDNEAKVIAGDKYKEDHELEFMYAGSTADLGDEDNWAPGLEDIHTLAADTARWAGECAAETEAPPLPSE